MSSETQQKQPSGKPSPKRSSRSEFCVYEHWRPDTDVCFYVGKGSSERLTRTARKNRHHAAIAAKLNSQGLAIDVRIVARGLTEGEAFSQERERIAFWRNAGITLANRTDGGEGTSGWIAPQQYRDNLGARMRGKKFPGRKLSQAHIEAISRGLKGSKRTPEQRARMSAAQVGNRKAAYPRSAETRKKIGDANRGRVFTEEHRKKLANAKKGNKNRLGRVHSQETKDKISRAKRGTKYRVECSATAPHLV